MIYSVCTYGAVGDGKTDDRASIQQAIDDCTANGGGTVLLESGKTYYSSSIQIKKNVELYIEKGAVLKATANIDDYIRPCEFINDPKTAKVGNPVVGKPSFVFIYGFEADGCTICGGGEIDGSCYDFVERKSQYYVTGNFYPRPTCIYIEKSNHITVKDVTVKNAPFWTLHPAGCDDVLISNIRILNPLDVANSDGIDPDHCQNVRILGCHIECADDCICLKTTNGNREYGPTENVIVEGCTLTSTSAAFKIGTEGVGNFKNIMVSNCIISRSNRGLSIQIRDGGNVENVLFSNIFIETRRFCSDWWGTAEPITITCTPRDNSTEVGSISNVRYRDITCSGENGALFFADEFGKISDISLENVKISLERKSKWPVGEYDLRPGYLHSIEKQNNHPIYSVGVENLELKNVETNIDESCKMFERDNLIKNFL